MKVTGFTGKSAAIAGTVENPKIITITHNRIPLFILFSMVFLLSLNRFFSAPVPPTGGYLL
jgi:hypothetical protein